jgi:hypothetical protein
MSQKYLMASQGDGNETQIQKPIGMVLKSKTKKTY